MPFNTGIQSRDALSNAEFGLHLKKKTKTKKMFRKSLVLRIFKTYYFAMELISFCLYTRIKSLNKTLLRSYQIYYTLIYDHSNTSTYYRKLLLLQNGIMV